MTINIQAKPTPIQWVEEATVEVVIGGEAGEIIGGEAGEKIGAENEE